MVARTTESPLRLLRDAAGPPRVAMGKAARLAKIFAGYMDSRRLDARLGRLHARVHVEEIPTRVQLAVGAIDFRFHQVLRFLDEPASLADPTIPPMLRSNVDADSRYRALEEIFGSMTTAMRYFRLLPTSLAGAARHLRTVSSPFTIAV